MPIPEPHRAGRKMEGGDLGHVPTSGLTGREGDPPRGNQGDFTGEEERGVGRQQP